MFSSQLVFRVFMVLLTLIIGGFSTAYAENHKAKDGMEQKKK